MDLLPPYLRRPWPGEVDVAGSLGCRIDRLIAPRHSGPPSRPVPGSRRLLPTLRVGRCRPEPLIRVLGAHAIEGPGEQIECRPLSRHLRSRVHRRTGHGAGALGDNAPHPTGAEPSSRSRSSGEWADPSSASECPAHPICTELREASLSQRMPTCHGWRASDRVDNLGRYRSRPTPPIPSTTSRCGRSGRRR